MRRPHSGEAAEALRSKTEAIDAPPRGGVDKQVDKRVAEDRRPPPAAAEQQRPRLPPAAPSQAEEWAQCHACRKWRPVATQG